MAGIDSYTKLMLHCNGTDGSTTFTDSSASAHTVTANGNAQIDTSDSKFGGGSALLDGTGDFLRIADSDDWHFGSGDFTIDLWVSRDTSDRRALITQRGEVDAYTWWRFSIFGNGEIRFTARDNNVEIAEYISAAQTWNTGQWYHLAVVRHGVDIKIYRDGVSLSLTVQTAIGTNSIPDSPNYLDIGSEGGDYFYGRLDEIRISKGIARWTADFTPPTAEYSASTGWTNISKLAGISASAISKVNGIAVASIAKVSGRAV